MIRGFGRGSRRGSSRFFRSWSAWAGAGPALGALALDGVGVEGAAGSSGRFVDSASSGMYRLGSSVAVEEGAPTPATRAPAKARTPTKPPITTAATSTAARATASLRPMPASSSSHRMSPL